MLVKADSGIAMHTAFLVRARKAVVLWHGWPAFHLHYSSCDGHCVSSR